MRTTSARGSCPPPTRGRRLGHGGLKPQEARIPFIGEGSARRDLQRLELDLIAEMDRREAATRGPDGELDARIASFELAFRLQTEAPEIQDISSETAATRRIYGLDDPATADFGTQCLLARRLSERGVRFVQCNLGGWDAHNNLKANHAGLARAIDRPIAGLLTDLKQRGLWDETLVVWGGEFGRTPTCEGADGRDHNPHGYTMWLAGGGVKAGLAWGKTDDYGYYAVEDKVHVHDLHATILHLLGLDHKRLTYRYAGRDFRLTDVHGELVKGILVVGCSAEHRLHTSSPIPVLGEHPTRRRSRPPTRRDSQMTDPNRREFLASAGGALASASLRLARPRCERRSGRRPIPSRPTAR